ncbi:MAG: methyltransferase [Ghiorsea sp.]
MIDSPALTLLLEAVQNQQAQNIGMFNAQPHPKLSQLHHQSNLQLEQTFKPYTLDIEALSLSVTKLEGEVDVMLLIPSKDKQQSLGWMASAFSHLREGGKLIVACENQYGAKSYEKALKKLAGQVGSASKSKCRVFSAKKTNAVNQALQAQWLVDAAQQRIESHGLWSQAGLFSWKKADVGSSLLLEFLPKISGKVMDLCCGYGLLASNIIRSNADVSEIHLVEAEQLALDCAQKNMSEFDVVKTYHLDAVRETLPKHMDVVVCNPPFHTGQTRDVELGQKIVSKACGALTYGGELYLVANRQLPYEKILATHLREVECLVARDGFKVIRGKK